MATRAAAGGRGRALAATLAAYGTAAIVAIGVGFSVDAPALLLPLWAQLAAVVTVFGFSVAHDNSNLADPLWSVAPLGIALYWTWSGGPDEAMLRQVVALVLVAWWGARLTFNWWRGWEGLQHEDWRYAERRDQLGSFYWPFSLVGIHLAPALFVFAGCLPLYVVLSVGRNPLGPLDLLAAVVTAGAIALESRSDRELSDFRRARPVPGAILSTGTWSWSRHPNYLGEMGFWWGLALFGLAANPGYWWTCGGALAITVMFRTISLRLIDTRMLTRRPEYAEYMERTPAFIPRLSGASRTGAPGGGES